MLMLMLMLIPANILQVNLLYANADDDADTDTRQNPPSELVVC